MRILSLTNMNERIIALSVGLAFAFALAGSACDSQECAVKDAKPESVAVSQSNAVVTPQPVAAGKPQLEKPVYSNADAIREKWGIEISSVRMSAGGYMVDFRYRVLDPVKAKSLATHEFKPYLIDQATGYKLLVPNTPKLGPLRQTSKNLTKGTIYFALFANPGRLIKSGSKVTTVIGDFRVEDLIVQ